MSVAASAARVQCQAQQTTKKKIEVKRIKMRTCGRWSAGADLGSGERVSIFAKLRRAIYVPRLHDAVVKLDNN